MLRNVFTLFVVTAILTAIFLFIPVSFSKSEIEFPKESPIALISGRDSKARLCASNITYVTEKSKIFHEKEGYEFIVDDRCANLQEELVLGIRNDRVDRIRNAIEQGANPQTIDFSSLEAEYPLKIASYKNVETAKLLLDNGADPNQEFCCCATCNSALTIAIEQSNVKMVKLLLERGANVNYKRKFSDGGVFSVGEILSENYNNEVASLLEESCDGELRCRAKYRIQRFIGLFSNHAKLPSF